MAVSMTTNVSSLEAQATLAQTNLALNKSIQKLSSGNRIVQSVDDPAGLAISERLKAQIRSLKKARQNGSDGLSLLQVAEGGMMAIADILIRMRELSLQASNGTLTSQDRSFLNTEFLELRSEIDRISDQTKFNGVDLLNGDIATGQGSLVLQVGVNKSTNDTITIHIANLGVESIADGSSLSAAGSIGGANGTNAQNMLSVLDSAINFVSAARSQVGAQMSRLLLKIRSLEINEQTLQQANSRIRDVDVAEESGNMTRLQILMQAGVSVLSQANSLSGVALQLLQF